MKHPPNPSISGAFAGSSVALTAAFSFAVIVATFFISNAALAFEIKTAIFVALALGYLALCAAFYLRQRRQFADFQVRQAESAITEEIENKLLVLEEANEFFGASLKFSDMFRLVASRVGEIVPFDACVVYLRAEGGGSLLRVRYAVGASSPRFMSYDGDTNRGVAVKAFLSGRVQIDAKLLYERRVFPPEIVGGFESAAAVPLASRGEAYGALVLYGAGARVFDESAETLLAAVGERVAPLFANSFAFEQSLSNALTDALTSLPNERGFFLVLENQLAESVRFRDERPLSVLAMDVRNFAEINEKYGHAAGDRLLSFAAAVIKKQLRGMDVLTRSAGDEFLAVLPTANEKIAAEVIDRVKRAFAARQFEPAERERVSLAISFGAATFWRDGETAAELLKTARLKKSRDKALEGDKVILFPKGLVN